MSFFKWIFDEEKDIMTNMMEILLWMWSNYLNFKSTFIGRFKIGPKEKKLELLSQKYKLET
jgi:hypothetical protein